MKDYLLDNYGECLRGKDCYWGKDKQGNWNGCLRTVWKGRQCQHWVPLGVTTLEELHHKMKTINSQNSGA